MANGFFEAYGYILYFNRYHYNSFFDCTKSMFLRNYVHNKQLVGDRLVNKYTAICRRTNFA